MSADPGDGGVPRIGLAGFFLEANRFSPVTTGETFVQSFDLAGDALAAELHSAAPRLLPDSPGFVTAMDAAGPWTPVALRMAGAQPGGPAEQGWFDAFCADLLARLGAEGPLHGLFISSHGAALATEDDDPDGTLFQRLRAALGPGVPIVAVFDLHTNVSRRMTDALSGFVAYRTNPHVDLHERGAEAAALLRGMLADGPGEVVLAKLPFLPASTDQLIAPGTPYHALVEQGQQAVNADVLNVSLCGGFPLADCADCGFSVVVTTRHGARVAGEAVAQRMAAAVWARRKDFITPLTALGEAVRQAVATGMAAQGERLILADVADNPGGGGGGNTTALLQALVDAGAQGVLLGVFTDAALAAEAHAHGTGATFEARFNRDAGADPFARPFNCPARVLQLSDGSFVGRQGLLRGSTQQMGPSALLDVAGVHVAVISHRQQLLDPAQLDVLGVDLDQVRTLVVKSRGHFRAAFADFASPERILEVDGPGLTTPRLARLPLARIPRPVFPLDPDAAWPARQVAP